MVAGALTVDTLKDGERVTAVAVDLVSPDGAAQLVDEAVERHGRLDVLVNNVGGVQLRLNGFLEVTDDDFERSFQLNFFAALRATRKAVAANAGPRRRDDRQRRLSQLLLPPRWAGHRLRRRQSRPSQHGEGALTGTRPEGHPDQ